MSFLRSQVQLDPLIILFSFLFITHSLSAEKETFRLMHTSGNKGFSLLRFWFSTSFHPFLLWFSLASFLFMCAKSFLQSCGKSNIK